jgi:hypothetical protein
MSDLLETAIIDPAIGAFEVGYVAESSGNPHGTLTHDLLDRASGAHDMQANAIFPWMQDPGKPEASARIKARTMMVAYGLSATSDLHDFLDGRTVASTDSMDGVRL